MAKHCDLLITINEEDYALAKERFSSRTKVAHIHGVGVDEKRYYPATAEEQRAMRAAEGLSEDDFVILCTGELNENKNQSTLIRAAALLKDEIPKLKILLAGNGPKEQELRELTASLGLQDTVRFLGYRTDLVRITPAVDLVVSCSFREGMPVNIIEAMLCKKPVVASHNRGHDELVKAGTSGALFDPLDALGLAEGIRQLAADNELTLLLGTEGLKRAEQYKVSFVSEEIRNHIIKGDGKET